MSIYVFSAVFLTAVAGLMIADYNIRRSRQEERIRAKWSDIWDERLRNGR